MSKISSRPESVWERPRLLTNGDRGVASGREFAGRTVGRTPHGSRDRVWWSVTMTPWACFARGLRDAIGCPTLTRIHDSPGRASCPNRWMRLRSSCA